MERNHVLFSLLVLLCVAAIEPRIFNKCELARELAGKHNFNRALLSSWICLVEHESGYDTARVSYYPPVAGIALYRSYGLFQINNQTYCSNYSHGGVCRIRCEDLARNDITKAAQCAKTIFMRDGFKVWYKWSARCKGKRPHELPSLNECFRPRGHRSFADDHDLPDSGNETVVFEATELVSEP